jgi:hypothetical protein
MTGSHRYLEPVKPYEAGKILKVDRDGVVEWEKQDWDHIKCSSSDTSIRVRCDGQRLQFTGNIGRFHESDNVTGLGVQNCVEKYYRVLKQLGFDVYMFGSVHRQGEFNEAGTTLSRVDLAGNFECSDYGNWCNALMARPIFRRHPRQGRYGPTWGYESKRGNWWKAKVYDKTAEQEGLRSSRGGATLARFEVQLGSEYLKRESLNYVKNWTGKEGEDMANIIYGRFLAEIQRESVGVEDWSAIPPRLRMYAVLWRDGQLPTMKMPTFYRVKRQLKEYGIDISIPCNVLSLVQRVRTVEVRQVPGIRRAA